MKLSCFALIFYLLFNFCLLLNEEKSIEFIGIFNQGCKSSGNYEFNMFASPIQGFGDEDYIFYFSLKQPDYAYSQCTIKTEEEYQDRKEINCQINGEVFHWLVPL